MESKNNSQNLLRENYMRLDNVQKRAFKRRIMDLFEWWSESTFLRKTSTRYEPTEIEVLASKMVADEVTEMRVV